MSSITKQYSTPSKLVGKAGIGFKEEQTRAICNVYDGNLGKMSLPLYTLHIACVCSPLDAIPAFPTSWDGVLYCLVIDDIRIADIFTRFSW